MESVKMILEKVKIYLTGNVSKFIWTKNLLNLDTDSVITIILEVTWTRIDTWYIKSKIYHEEHGASGQNSK